MTKRPAAPPSRGFFVERQKTGRSLWAYLIGLLIGIAIGFVSATQAKALDFCFIVGDLAANVMEQRQAGASMSVMMRNVQATQDGPLQDFVVAAIMKAYEKPRFSSDEYRKRAVDDFRNEVELACYQGN